MTHNGARYFHKTFLARNVFESVKDFFLGSRAERSLRAAAMLRENGFLAPQVVMVGYDNSHDFIVTAAVPKHITASEFFVNALQLPPPDFINHKRRQLKHLGEVVGKLHAAGIFHGDLLLGNLLFSGDNPSDYQVYFIDNERTQRRRIFTTRARLKNLAQLNRFCTSLTVTDRLRFFNRYIRYNPEVGRRRWIGKVLARTAKKYTK